MLSLSYTGTQAPRQRPVAAIGLLRCNASRDLYSAAKFNIKKSSRKRRRCKVPQGRHEGLCGAYTDGHTLVGIGVGQVQVLETLV